MSKYQNSSKPRKSGKKRSPVWFILGMVIYAALFLGATYYGLGYLWDYMEAYEASRPGNTVDAYMEQLTAEHIVDMNQAVIDQIDHNIQSEEECRAYLLEALSGGITHAKKSKECTNTRQVYVLRTGSNVIGEFSIKANEPDEYGFTTWELEQESFDMSYLITGETVSMTVPDVCAVWVNGYQLTSDYIIEDGIEYEGMKDYFEDYQFPTRVTYQAGPFLGRFQMTATDPDGSAVTFDENTDYSKYYLNCSEEEVQKLNAFTEDFIDKYVAFTGSNKNTRYKNYASLITIIDEDSDMAKRLADALDGLQFGQSKGDEVVSITTHIQLRLEDGRYLCDVTYEVDTTGREGVVRTTTNVKLYVIESSGTLKLESMNIY